MNTLPEVIGSMTKEEIRNFKLYLNRTEHSGERKDTQLFDHIRKTFPNYDEEKIFRKLYDGDDKNSLYRLKNRLFDDIGRSLCVHHLSHGDENLIQYNLLLSRIFKEKGHTQLSSFYLHKAAKRARESELPDWLDTIYGDFIKLSHDTLEINPEEFIQLRKKNREQLNKIQEIDDILAALIYRIKVSQNFAKQNTEILKLLQNTVNDFSKNKEVKTSPVLRFKIYHSVSRILLQQQDYKSLEKYLLKTYTEFSEEKLFSKNNHDTKLQMLTYLINSLFKNKKIESSLQYTDLLKVAMKEYNGIYYEKYLFYYYNSLVINYAVKDIRKAIEILQEARDNAVIRKLPVYNVFIYLNLAVLYFENKQYKEALKNLVKPMTQDAFQQLDSAWHLKLSVFELMLRYELGDQDYLEHRLERIRKDYHELLKSAEYARQRVMLQAIEVMSNDGQFKKAKPVKSKLENWMKKELADSSTDTDIINYTDWLQAKLN